MKKNFRIRKRKDFVNASLDGVCIHTDFFIIQINKNSLNHYRVGFTASKRVGNAVVRNRCKRRMRAMADFLLATLGLNGIDYIFIAKNRLYYAKWGDLIQKATHSIQILNSKLIN